MTFPSTNPDDIAQLLNGIRDKARLEIILLLGQTNGMNVTEIASHFRISRPAISHHLKVLKDAEIVRSEKQGQEVYYRLNSSRIVTGLREVADMIENCCQPKKP